MKTRLLAFLVSAVSAMVVVGSGDAWADQKHRAGMASPHYPVASIASSLGASRPKTPPAWHRPDGQRRAYLRSLPAYDNAGAFLWGTPFWPGWSDQSAPTTVYTTPARQRIEIVNEIPVGGVQAATVGAPTLYVINADGRKNARVLQAGAIRPLGPPDSGPSGDQGPRIIELFTR